MAYRKRNHEHMASKMDDLKVNDPSLKRPYNDKIGAYPCRSFNLGRQTAMRPHVNSTNLAQSWCSITPIGSFDPKVGGHLVLKDLRIVMEFPPGSTILIPSALITHYNTPVRPHETWFSIIQYAAGGLLRTGLRPMLHGRPVLPTTRLRPEKGAMDRGGEGRYPPSPRCESYYPHSPFAKPMQMPRLPPKHASIVIAN
jgi:hypothetical protein